MPEDKNKDNTGNNTNPPNVNVQQVSTGQGSSSSDKTFNILMIFMVLIIFIVIIYFILSLFGMTTGFFAKMFDFFTPGGSK